MSDHIPDAIDAIADVVRKQFKVIEKLTDTNASLTGMVNSLKGDLLNARTETAHAIRDRDLMQKQLEAAFP